MARQFVQKPGGEKITLEQAAAELNVEPTIQTVADIGGFSPVSPPKDIVAPIEEPMVLGMDNIPEISQGTERLRDRQILMTEDLDRAITGEEEIIDTPSDILSQLTEMQKRIGTTTDEEMRQIEEAGRAAGAAFAPRVEEAVEARRRELPRAIVRAGERGGFETTQLAGVAAVAPTAPRPGEPFVGAGGILSQQRQLLDRNVSLLRSAQQQAINAARAAERKFIQTGKRQDFQDAMDLVKLNEQLRQNEEQMNIRRQQLAFDIGTGIAREERAVAKEEREIEKFKTERAEQTAANIAIQLVQLDQNNNVIEPLSQDIIDLAQQEGIDANILAGEVNRRIDEVQKIARENRRAELDELKKAADIQRTQFLTEKERQLLPLTLREKALNIDSKLLSMTKTQLGIEKLQKELDEFNPAELGISQVEVLGDLQNTVNQLNAGQIELTDVPDELKPFVSLQTNIVGESEFRLNEPTKDQFKIMVKRRAQNIQAQTALEDSVRDDLLSDPSPENQEALRNLIVSTMGIDQVTANSIINDVARKNNIDLGEPGRAPGQEVEILGTEGQLKVKG